MRTLGGRTVRAAWQRSIPARTDEPVALGPASLDEARGTALVIERLAHGAHAARERILVDVASVPELFEQFGARNQPVAVCDEMQQHLERPVGEVDELAIATAQPARRRFDLEFADAEAAST